MSVFIFVFSFLLESFQILLLIGFDFLLQVEEARMLARMFEFGWGVILRFTPVVSILSLYFYFLYIEDNVIFWLGVSIAVFDLHEKNRAFIYLKFRRIFLGFESLVSA